MKKYELQNIDDFILEFNKPIHNLGTLKRLSNENQDNPDAICLFQNNLRIGLEATIVMLPEDEPFSKMKNTAIAYNPFPALEILIKRIKDKSLNDYKDADTNEVWLLISGGSYISDHDLRDRITSEKLNTKFKRIFIHKGIAASLLEIQIDTN